MDSDAMILSKKFKMINYSMLVSTVVILHAIYFSSGSCATCENIQIPKNIRGYIYYPDLGPNTYDNPQVEILFDYDPMAIPVGSQINLECIGYKMDNNCSDHTAITAAWRGDLSQQLKPYNQILMDSGLDLACYLCRARITCDNDTVQGPWSEYAVITLPYTYSKINPKPTLLICQSIKQPQPYPTGSLIKILDMDGVNNLPNETLHADYYKNCKYLDYTGYGTSLSLWSLFDLNLVIPTGSAPFCVDWISSWAYRVNDTKGNCIEKFDMSNDMQTPSKINPKKFSDPLACFDHRIQQILCYAPRNLLLISIGTDFKNRYRLIMYNLTSNVDHVILDENGTNSGVTGPMSHFLITLDWRPFWSNSPNASANVAFISNQELWSYSIRDHKFKKMIDLTYADISDTNDILRFVIDWSYFYWIDTNYSIHTYSWTTGQRRILDKFQPYAAEVGQIQNNLTRPVSDQLEHVISLAIFSPAVRPYPYLFECLLPDLNITQTMTTDTTGSVLITKVWNQSIECQGMKKPPIRLRVNCTAIDIGNAESKCQVANNMTLDRYAQFSSYLTNLILGHTYNITVEASIFANEIQISKSVVKINTLTFVASRPPAPASAIWWRYVLIAVSLAVIAISILITIYFRWYKKHKAIQAFLRRGRIDASELALIRILGEGEFGEVWLANFVRDSTSLEVALKMRKSKSTIRSAIISADSFFQEAVALDYLRHPNIILAHGICTNYKDYPPILVLEYMNGGSALDYVHSERSHLTNTDLIKICQDILAACCHLTQMNVVHKDIGARNVLIRKNARTSKPDLAKLTDFGLAKDIGKRESGYTSSNMQTIFHVPSTAPEGFDGKFSTQSDVWSFGIFVWELYSSIDHENPEPYSGLEGTPESILEHLRRGRTLEQPRTAPASVYLLMRQCWSFEAKDRPTFKQLNAAWRLLAQHETSNGSPLISVKSNPGLHHGTDNRSAGSTTTLYEQENSEPEQIISNHHHNGYIAWDRSTSDTNEMDENKIELGQKKEEQIARYLFSNINHYKLPALID